VWVDVPLGMTFSVKRLADSGRGPLQFSVTLTSPATARLELLDVSGRVVAGRDLSGLAPGSHEVSLDSAAHPGVYWARLSQGGKMVSTKVALVR
jgi:hypothetical protein